MKRRKAREIPGFEDPNTAVCVREPYMPSKDLLGNLHKSWITKVNLASNVTGVSYAVSKSEPHRYQVIGDILFFYSWIIIDEGSCDPILSFEQFSVILWKSASHSASHEFDGILLLKVNITATCHVTSTTNTNARRKDKTHWQFSQLECYSFSSL